MFSQPIHFVKSKKKRYFMETNEFYNMSSDCVITFKQRMFFLGQHSRN